MSSFSEDEIAAFKEVFALYVTDKEKETIPAADIGSIMRVLEKNPLEAEIAAMLGDVEIKPSDIHVSDAVLAPGYGQMNDATAKAIRLTAQEEGIILDPVYSGRTMAGLIALVESGRIPQGARVLFIHTGGNKVIPRFLVFLISTFALMAMWGVLGYHLFRPL